MTTPGLCEYCALVPLDLRQLDAELENKNEKPVWYDKPHWELGPAEGVRFRSSYCRLCRLVSMALYHESRLRCAAPIPGDRQVELCWCKPETSSYGPVFVIKVYQHGVRSLSSADEQAIVIDFVEDPLDHLTPDRGEAVNMIRARQWIEECLESHRDCNAEFVKRENTQAGPQGKQIGESHRGLNILRLLDVQNNCLIETVDGVKYVALSYLWGLAVNFRLTTANYNDLVHRPGSLDRYWGSLPRTIQDAVTFVRDMGERYLWCDALCLVQNDKEDVQRGLESMDYIYEQALFTIVGACGHDADAGLPGVLPGSRLSARASGVWDEIIPGVTLGLDISLYLSLKASVYRSRGWTFQEEVLSQRLVYFADNRVYFRCHSTTESENGGRGPNGQLAEYMDFFTKNEKDEVHRLIQLRKPVEDFADMLEIYSRRALTYQTDALNAMAAIVRRVSDRMKCGFIEGIPRSAFDVIILFKHGWGSNLQRREGFPSYSWTGWRGPVKVLQKGEFKLGQATNLEMNTWLTTETWIIWYARNTDGTCSLVWDPHANYDFPWDDLEYVGYRTRTSFQLSDLHIEASHTHPTIEIDCNEAPGETPFRRYHLLQFWTLSVFLYLTDIDIQEATAIVFDPTEKRSCGFLFIDGLSDTRFYETTSDNSSSPQRSFELILLSSAECTWAVLAHVLGVKRVKPLLKTYGVDIPLYNVMVLEWMGNVAERRGLGFILQSSVQNSLPPGPIWKEIVLS